MSPTDTPAIADGTELPLCVDLDGTLVKCDTLLDGLLLLLRKRPLQAWRVPLWLAGGKARLKREVANLAPLDAERLPYNAPLLRYLQEQRQAGRKVYLTTGAESALAERVAQHLKLFDGVVASDGTSNLIRQKKLALLKERFGEFGYVGNSGADLELLQNARAPMVANPTLGLRMAMRRLGLLPARTFEDRGPGLPSLLKALRVHQWSKNLLLLAPLAMSHRFTADSLGAAALAFFCFSFVASATYIANDLLDMESDRHHSTKRLRPFAAGDLSAAEGLWVALLLLACAAALLPLLPTTFALWIGIYIVATIAYSLYLKRVVIVDVLLLSGLYTLRLLAGGAATGTTISQWLAAFSSFLFLSLAMVKRFSELEDMRERGVDTSHGRGYQANDMEQIRSFGTASAYAAVVVFMLYIGRPGTITLYQHPYRLWLIVPLLLYWLTRVWLLASRGELHGDPVIFALRDWVSLGLGILVVLLAVFAA